MDNKPLKGKKAIVTGANRSIGQSIALNLGNQGADVVISYHNDQQGAEETVKKLQEKGVKAACFYTDFSEPNAAILFSEKAFNFLNTVDILINNAAMLSREQFFDLSAEKLATVFQVNVISPFSLAQACAKQMRDNKIQGVIINISSIASIGTYSRGCGYAASKAALNKLTKNMSLELGQYGIRVNAIAPGVIEAGMNATTKKEDPKRWSMYLEQIPLHRIGSPSDISHMVSFLVSEEASWITGKIFEVDGGHLR